MKKLFIGCLLLGACASAPAANLGNLKVTYNNGDEIFLNLENLHINTDGKTMMCANNEKEISLDLSTVSSLELTKDLTGIKGITEEGSVMVYDVDGVFHGEYESLEAAENALENPGIYIFRIQSHTIKFLKK